MPTSSRAAGRASGAAPCRVRGLRLAWVAAALAVLVLAGSARPACAADPEAVAAGSLLLPGLGQVVNGDYAAGATQATLYFVLLNQWSQHIDRPEYIPQSRREDEELHTLRTNRTTVIADAYGAAALDLAFYSSFAAYRDARSQPANAAGYDTPPPQESLQDLALAPFEWDWLKRPTTLAPLLVPLYLALAPAASDRLVYAPDDSIERREIAARFFFMHGGVAIGEEAFFRGFLNTALSDSLGRWWGLAGSSTVFGLAHSGQGAQATAVGAAVFGAYLGWLQQQNDYAIGQGVAVHFWWNFLTSLALLKKHEGMHVTPVTITLRF
jgi:membrane protease YdiL (CAAX protease family)